MKSDNLTNLLLATIALFLGLIFVANPPITNQAKALDGGGDMIVASSQLGGVFHLKGSKVRYCDYNRCYDFN